MPNTICLNGLNGSVGFGRNLSGKAAACAEILNSLPARKSDFELDSLFGWSPDKAPSLCAVMERGFTFHPPVCSTSPQHAWKTFLPISGADRFRNLSSSPTPPNNKTSHIYSTKRNKRALEHGTRVVSEPSSVSRCRAAASMWPQ